MSKQAPSVKLKGRRNRKCILEMATVRDLERFSSSLDKGSGFMFRRVE
jgi:hypothetical protein